MTHVQPAAPVAIVSADRSVANDGMARTQAFARALAADKRLLGYAGVAPDAAFGASAAIEGALPAGLRGTLYRNGPAVHELGGLRYASALDGDGMVQSFHLADGTVEHRARIVRTGKLTAEIAAGRRRRPVFGTAIPDAEGIAGPDDLNVANTSVLPFGPDLLALWEGGSAHRIDPATLETIGPKAWSLALRGLPFSAHPRVDPAGRLWNFGLDTLNSMLVLYDIAPDGAVARADVVRVPGMTMVHDFVVTAHHLVFLLPPFRFDRRVLETGASFLDAHEWLPEAPLRVLVIAKADLKTHQVFDLPNGFVFHLGNGWEDEAGVIRFDYVRAADATTMTGRQRDIMRGVHSAGSAGQVALVTLDPASGKIEQTIIDGPPVEFPRVDPRVVGQRYRQLYLAAAVGGAADRAGYDAIRRIDIETGAVDEYRYGPAVFVEEHVMVPDPARSGEGEGWLVGTALDTDSGRTMLSVFDAMDLAAGPIARATLPYALPLGLHGHFQAG